MYDVRLKLQRGLYGEEVLSAWWGRPGTGASFMVEGERRRGWVLCVKVPAARIWRVEVGSGGRGSKRSDGGGRRVTFGEKRAGLMRRGGREGGRGGRGNTRRHPPYGCPLVQGRFNSHHDSCASCTIRPGVHRLPHSLLEASQLTVLLSTITVCCFQSKFPTNLPDRAPSASNGVDTSSILRPPFMAQ